MSRRLKVLLSAYACEPNKGSEPEVGWQWALQMARFHDVTVLTRANNQPAIERELPVRQGKRPLPRFVYYDENPWVLRWKKRLKGTKPYYIIWQKSVREIVADLHHQEHFDLLHHVTFAGFRYPTAIWGHDVPCIWGPIGGIESIPASLLPWRYPKPLAHELLRNANNFLQSAPFHVLPQRADETTLILASTEDMRQLLAKFGFRTRVMPTIGLHAQEQVVAVPRTVRSGPLRLLFVGNIITLKGVDLALEALARSQIDATFTLVGDGPFMRSAKALAGRLNLGGRVEFRGRLPRQEVLKLYPEFDLYLLPSLHDTGSYAVIEAMSNEMPVVCLDCGGPALAVQEGCGIRVPLGRRREVIAGLAEAIRQYDQDRQLLLQHGRTARKHVMQNYDWDKKGEQMNEVYQSAVALGKSHSQHGTILRPRERSFLRRVFGRMFTTSGIAITGLTLLLIGAVGFLSLSHLKRQAHRIVEDTLPGLSYAGAANANLAQGFNRMTLMLLTQDPVQRANYRKELEEFNQRTSEYLNAYRKSIYSAEDQARYDAWLRHRKEYLQVREQVLALVDRNQRSEAIELCKRSLLPAYNSYKGAGEEILEYNMRQGKTQGGAIMTVCTITQIAVAVIGVAIFLIGFTLGFFK